MTETSDYRYMIRALRLAQRGLFTTQPNPRVGCVLVGGGEIIGEGWHERAGEPHAEINALRQAGDRARGATAYVTLEPCCHQGRTPPCSDALIAAGVARVVVAMQDPNSLVAGQGLRQLREAGIVAETGILEDQARALNRGFVHRFEQHRPLVRCKIAGSLDGRTAMASGESQWITGASARRDVQRLRAQSSAILTGIGTVLADDPSLNVRWDETGMAPSRADALRQPLRVVMDTGLRMSAASRMLALPGQTLILSGSDDPLRIRQLEGAGAEVVRLPVADGGLDIAAALALLAEREINEVLVEAGPGLCGSLLRGGWIDELIVYLAPHLMGDRGRGMFHVPGLDRMGQRRSLRITDVRAVGEDWRITCHPDG